MMKKVLTAMLIAFLSGSAVQAQETQKFTADKHNEYGLVYSLPVTHFDIVINAEQITRTAGPFYMYAKKYLGINNPIVEDSKDIEIKSVDIVPFGVPDKENEFLVEFKKAPTYFILNSKGLPLSINTQNTAPVEEAITHEAEAAVTPNQNSAMSLPGELLMSESTAKKAEIAANMIYKLRESRTAFITGEADEMPDGAALKVIMEQLKKQETSLMALFAGTTVTEQVQKHIEYVPGEEVSEIIPFRISDYYGVVDSEDLSGAPVYLTLKITKRGEMPVNEKGETKKLPKNAVMYNIPGEANITLEYEGETICNKTLQVAQYGIQFGLDPKMFTDKKNPSYAIFYPETGAIMEIGKAQPLETEE